MFIIFSDHISIKPRVWIIANLTISWFCADFSITVESAESLAVYYFTEILLSIIQVPGDSVCPLGVSYCYGFPTSCPSDPYYMYQFRLIHAYLYARLGLFIHVCPSLNLLGLGLNLYSSFGLDNGLAPTRRQAIIWTKDGKFADAYMRHSASMS